MKGGCFELVELAEVVGGVGVAGVVVGGERIVIVVGSVGAIVAGPPLVAAALTAGGGRLRALSLAPDLAPR